MTSEASFTFEQNSLQIQLPLVEKTEYEVKFPTEITLGADLLIELKNHFCDPMDAPKWLIPVHKVCISENIPYFAAMFNEGSNWRENKKANDDSRSGYRFGLPSISFDRPQAVSNETILQYFIKIYKSNTEIQLSDNYDSSLYFKKDNILEFLELSNFFGDDVTEDNCRSFIAKNMCKELMLNMFNFPNVLDLTRIYAENFLNQLESEDQVSKDKIKELSCQPKRGPCTRAHVAPASGMLTTNMFGQAAGSFGSFGNNTAQVKNPIIIPNGNPYNSNNFTGIK